MSPAGDEDSSGSGPMLPNQHIRCEVGSLCKTGPLVLDARLSRLDPLRKLDPSKAAFGQPSSHS
jgi:hypothetical protein